MNIVCPTQVKALSACNMAIQRDLFYSLGGFDEELRFNEDSDLSYRLRKSGHGMLYSPRARVNHLKKIGSYRGSPASCLNTDIRGEEMSLKAVAYG